MEPVVLKNVPVLDGLETVLIEDPPVTGGSIIGQREEGSCGAPRAVALYDDATGNAFRLDGAYDAAHDPRESGEAPLVRIVGDLAGQTGQVTVLQAEGRYRRYSRWDRISLTTPNRPDAIVRTLPQCGCGGYLGAPMMFDSFAEMTAYFFVLFSEAGADAGGAGGARDAEGAVNGGTEDAGAEGTQSECAVCAIA